MINFIRLFLVFLLASTIASANVVSPIPSPKRFNPGDIMRTTTDWNATVVGVYSYINNNIVPALNKLTAKGDTYIYDGAALQKLAVGTDGQKKVARSSEPFGARWETYTGEDPLTTKGDILYYDGAGSIQRLPVGVDGTVLTLVDGLPAWTDNTTNPFPKGAIVSWSPAGAGTSTIPSGWVLCDGGSGSPNLIGLFVIGTKPTGSASSPSPGGFGAYTANTQHGSSTHSHTGVIAPASVCGAATVTVIRTGTGGSNGSPGTHLHVVPSVTRGISSGSCEPADYSLVYIMKT